MGGWFEEETPKEKVARALKEPAGSLLALGPLSFLSGLSLIIVIPILLIILGVGIYFVLTFLPFVLAGTLFGFFYWLLRKIKVDKPYNIVLPLILACIGSVPLFVDSLRSLAMGQVQATVTAMGVEAQVASAVLTEVGVWFSIIFSGAIAFGSALSQKLENRWPLIAGFSVLLLGIAFLIDQSAAMGASLVVAVGGTVTPLLQDPIFYVLAASIATMGVTSLGVWWKKR